MISTFLTGIFIPFKFSAVMNMVLYKHLASFYFSNVFFFFRATMTAYGSSQASGRIGATVAGLQHSHSNGGSESCLQASPQLTAMPDLRPTDRRQGSNPYPHGY